MSSETITRNDLKAILEKCGMSGIAFQEAGILRVTGKAITNTSNAEIQPDTCNVYGDSNIFSTNGTYITVNKNCMCVALITLGISATADATKLKVLTICKRSASTVGLSTNAAGILDAWDVVTATDIISLQEGDVISFCGRTHDSNCTLYNCRAVLIPITSQIGTNVPADFIVEQGKSGIWTYRKWDSGIAECWGTMSGDWSVNTASPAYGGYRSTIISIDAFPFTFTSNPCATGSVVGGSSQGAWLNHIELSTTGGNFYFSAGSSLAAATRYVDIHLKGRWK